jgi:hypothetical protein
MYREIILNINVSFTSISAIFLVTACGGGGGDKSEETVSEVLRPIETSPITISANNIEQTSSDAVSTVFDNLALTTADGLTGVVIDKNSQKVRVSDIEWALKWLNRASLPADIVTGVITTQTDNCAISGSTTTTFDLQNNLGISVNDSITIQSNDCKEGQETLNGKFTFTFTQLVNFLSLESYSTLGIRIDLEDLSVTLAGETVNMVGSYTLVHIKDAYGEQQNITADEISISSSKYQQSIKKLISQQVFTDNTNIETLNVSNQLIDEFLNGSVQIRTVDDFQFSGKYASAPYAGSMKITGAKNSSILLTILNTSEVQLESDFDGNNTVDDTRIVAWNSLN